MCGCELDDPAATLRRERAAARILEGRDRVEKGRRVAVAQGGLERVGVEPLVVHRDEHDLGAELPQDLERTVVGRLLDEDAPAARQPLGEEDEALQRAVAEQHARGLDAVALRDPRAQRRVAATRPVGEDRLAVALDRRARAVGDLLDRQAFGRGDAAGEGDRVHGSPV